MKSPRETPSKRLGKIMQNPNGPAPTHIALPIGLVQQLIAILANNPYHVTYVKAIEACPPVHLSAAQRQAAKPPSRGEDRE